MKDRRRVREMKKKRNKRKRKSKSKRMYSSMKGMRECGIEMNCVRDERKELKN